MVIRIIKWAIEQHKNDPVYNCEVHSSLGCAHVDGQLCDMKTCNIRENYAQILAPQ